MKSDLELVRKILLACEDHPHGFAPQELKIDGYTDDEIDYHVHIAGDAGLLRVTDVTHCGSSSPCAIPRSTTWAGHEFLDNSKDETVWAKAKRASGNSSFDMLKAVLVGFPIFSNSFNRPKAPEFYLHHATIMSFSRYKGRKEGALSRGIMRSNCMV
ncbi:MAG: DUF2513 domain-containing protein [Planctomycetes bacterium]|jgi:hypothetical protein|nr:DUF2513 domain-containing protein [Planctomycetota bacterium]